jgi:hypothetical protein
VALPSALALAEEGALAGERSREIDTARRADPGASALWQGSYRRLTLTMTRALGVLA